MDYQPLSKWIISYYPNGWSTSIKQDYQPPSKWIISRYPNWMINLYQTGLSTNLPNGLSAAIQMDGIIKLSKWIINLQMDDQPLSNRIINHHPNGLSAIQIDDQPQILSAAIQMIINQIIQMDYQPLSKWIISYYPNGWSTSIKQDYQPPSKWIISRYPNGW